MSKRKPSRKSSMRTRPGRFFNGRAPAPRPPYQLYRIARLAIAASVVVFACGAGFSETRPPTTPTLIDFTSGAEPQYRLSIGDVLEFSVRGFPDLRQRSVIELNGDVSLPLAGRVRIVDMTIAEAQAAIKSVVTARPLAQKYSDGRESFTVLVSDDINISIAEYRPIYILGDVGKPGELAFRPGLTARQAIALAGGFDVMRYRLVNPFTESADMKGQQEALWTELTKARAQILRLRSELDGNESYDRADLVDIPLAATFVNQIADIEGETLKRRIADMAREREHLDRLVLQAEDKLKSLEALLHNEEQSLTEDKKEYSDMLEFNKRGTVPLFRMMDLRRVQSASATRLLQTRVLIDQAKRDHSEAVRNRERFEVTRRTELLHDLQDASVAANTLKAKLSANADKLVHTSLLKSRLVRGPGAKAIIYVYRVARQAKQAIDANENTLLLPGDTVEITLKNEFDVEDSREPATTRSAKASIYTVGP